MYVTLQIMIQILLYEGVSREGGGHNHNLPLRCGGGKQREKGYRQSLNPNP